jgi:LuxR family maltose regulon positive regulatory protein
LVEIYTSASSGKEDPQGNTSAPFNFSIPRSRTDLLPRPRLIDYLEQVAARELILISTPAGFGKTTLLANWARNTEKPVAWLSLDRDDNDPTYFWRFIVTAIRLVHAQIGGRTLSRRSRLQRQWSQPF